MLETQSNHRDTFFSIYLVLTIHVHTGCLDNLINNFQILQESGFKLERRAVLKKTEAKIIIDKL